MGLKKPNYFNGQKLTEADMTFGQSYAMNSRANHLKHLHSPGVISGLDVTVDAANFGVDVSAGYATNANGEVIYLESTTNIDFSQEPAGPTPPGQMDRYIIASYGFTLSDMATGDYGTNDHTRITENAAISASSSLPNDPTIDLVLATVTLDYDVNGVTGVASIDTSVRLLPELNKGTFSTRQLKLKVTGMPEANWPVLHTSHSTVHTLEVTANQLEAGGDLELTGNLTVSGALNTPGTLDATGTNINFQGDVVVTNLTTQGASTAIEAANLQVSDPVIRFNDYPNQSTPVITNGGLEVYRGGDAPNYPNANITWSETNLRWEMGLAGALNTSFAPNGNAILNTAYVGDLPGGAGDKAIFAHKDHATATNYALMQDDTGITSLNAATGGTLHFKVGEPPDPQADPHGNDVLKVTETQVTIPGGINQSDTWHDVPPAPIPPDPPDPDSLQNGWVEYNTLWHKAGYFKDKRGIVYLRGLMKSGTIGAEMFTLPAGYRPEFLMNFTVICSGPATGKINITAGGVVTPTHGSNAWLSLDGIRFRAFY